MHHSLGIQPPAGRWRVMTCNGKGWVLMGAAALLAPSTAHTQEAQPAQDIGASTPPELREFRLDTPPPKTAPEPTSTSPSQNPTSPTSEPRPETNQRPSTNQPQAREPHNGTVAPSRVKESTEPPPPATAEPAVEDVGSTAVPENLPETIAKNSVEGTKPTKTDSGFVTGYIWIGAVLAAFLALVAATLFLRRRQSRGVAGTATQLPLHQPSPPARLDQPKPAMAPLPTPKARATTPPPSGADPIFAEFKPETAQLSIASLSVTGKLTIINRGQAAIENLLMRSHMISAQNGQQEAILAFHQSKGSGSIQSLGSLAAGERIDAVIEIRQARTELSTFRWTEREFVAPIILINICGQAGNREVDLQLSHLIGREGGDASARMKPLPIDRGPKRFSGVSARPVIA